MRVESEVSREMKFRYRSEGEMKDSGLEWLGKIPDKWKITKLKMITKSIGRGKSPEYVEESDVRVINQACVYWDNLNLYNVKYQDENLNYYRAKLYKGDLLINSTGTGTLGRSIVFNEEGNFIADSHVTVVSCKNLKYSQYLGYIIRTNLYQGLIYSTMVTGSTNQIELSREGLRNMNIPISSEEELNCIVNFLDKKTAQFDTIISKKETLIQKLEEAKKSLISEVVTGKVKVVKTSKGYKLVERKKEEMKDSGVEWLGEIPSDWKVTKLKYNLYKIGSGKTPKGGAEVYTDRGVVFIRSQNVYNDGLRLDDVVFINEEIDNEMNNSRVKFNDVLLNITGASIGRSSLVDNIDLKANVNQHVCILRPITYKINPALLHAIIQSNKTQLQIEASQNGSSREGLNFEQIANIVIVKSGDMQEQTLIVQYIKNVIDNLYIAINKIRQQIEKLKEAKQSLISEAVTGKIEILD